MDGSRRTDWFPAFTGPCIKERFITENVSMGKDCKVEFQENGFYLDILMYQTTFAEVMSLDSPRLVLLIFSNTNSMLMASWKRCTWENIS
jgi:hypothetical protein